MASLRPGLLGRAGGACVLAGQTCPSVQSRQVRVRGGRGEACQQGTQEALESWAPRPVLERGTRGAWLKPGLPHHCTARQRRGRRENVPGRKEDVEEAVFQEEGSVHSVQFLFDRMEIGFPWAEGQCPGKTISRTVEGELHQRRLGGRWAWGDSVAYHEWSLQTTENMNQAEPGPPCGARKEGNPSGRMSPAIWTATSRTNSLYFLSKNIYFLSLSPEKTQEPG